jgi:hypothetical protein
MLLECGHCGAPLDVRSGQQAYVCRYCGHASRMQETRMLAPQTPPQWRPPPVWRPPPHVPADSATELRYRAQGSSVAGVMVLVGVLLAVSVAVGAGLYSGMRKSGSSSNPFSKSGGFDPAQLDAVTFSETAPELQQKTGGTLSKTYVNMPMNGLFDYGIFTWDEKDPSHPTQFSMHKSKGGCTPEHEAARARVRKRFGPRFDGKNWMWGPAYFSFDDKCTMVSFHMSFSGAGSGEEIGNWKRQTEVLWSVVKIDVFGRPGKISDSDALAYLARGYDLDVVAKAIAKTTIDDTGAVKKALPGANLRKFISLDAEIPLSHPKFTSARVSWNNEKGGGIRSVDLSGYGNKLADPIAMAKCLAPKMNGKLEIRETDYINKKSNAYITGKGASANVSEYGVNSYASGFGALRADAIETFLAAAKGCE